MSLAHFLAASPGLALLAAAAVVAVLIVIEARRARRAEARAHEHRARPHSAHVGTAAQDAAAILRNALTEAEHTDRSNAA